MTQIKQYKHALLKEQTHQNLRRYVADNKLRSFDDAIKKLLEAQK